MFTGIIEEVGSVVTIVSAGGGRRLSLRASFSQALRVDESVAVNGVCLTVVGTSPHAFDVVAIEETLRKTTLGSLSPGRRVNLERAMQMGGRIDGHLVQGHVDTTGVVASVAEERTGRLYTIQFDPSFGRYIIPVGSIALDGISLTVARLEHDRLTVAIIPHTYAHTNVSDWAKGARVNIEFDLIGKYVARSLEGLTERPAGGLSAQKLRDYGFE